MLIFGQVSKLELLANKILFSSPPKVVVPVPTLFPKIQSIFQWKNDIQIENEAVLIFKTSEKKYKDLEQFILKIHSYETPCILKLKIDKGQKTFFEWMEKTLN